MRISQPHPNSQCQGLERTDYRKGTSFCLALFLVSYAGEQMLALEIGMAALQH